MAAQDLSLKVLLSLQDKASGPARGFGSTLGDVEKQTRGFGSVLAGAGVAVAGLAVGLGIHAVQSAAAFQQSMLKNMALAGLSQAQYTSMSNQILDLAPKVGKSPRELADSLYYVLSAGVDASKAIDAVRYSAMLAASGMTTTSITASALTTAMKVYGLSSKEAADQIQRAVAEGKITMEGYSNSVGKLFQISKAGNRTIYETNAALDTLSNNGFPGAAQSSTGLQNLFTILDLKTDLLAKRFDKLVTPVGRTIQVMKDVHGQMRLVTEHVKGLVPAFDEARFKTMNLADQIAYLKKVTGGDPGKLMAILGNRNSFLAFQALSNNAKEYADHLGKMKHASDGAGAATEAFKITQQGFTQQMAQAKAAVDSLFVKIGLLLLPVLTKIAAQVVPLISQFADWIVKSGFLQQTANLLAGAFQLVFNVIGNILSISGVIIGFFQINQVAGALLIGTLTAIAAIIAVSVIPGLVMAGLAAVATFIAWAVAAGAAAIATIAATWPIILIGVIIAAVVAGIILAIKNWGKIMDFLSNKAQITADKVALAHIKMRISADDNQKKQAEKSLSNLQKEQASLLNKLKQAHSAQEREALQHQLRMVDAQIDGQNKRIAAIDADKQKQIDTQKELQAKLQEDQKNWFVRLLDDILGFFGMIFGAVGTFVGNFMGKVGQFKDLVIQKFKDIWNGVVNGAKSILNGLGTTIVNLVKIPVNLVIGGINHLIDGYNQLPKFGAPNLGHIPLLASGAENFQGGLAYVHAGEMLTYLPRGTSVTPAHRVSAALRSGSGGAGGHTTMINANITINAGNANPDEVARRVHTILSRDLRRSGSIGTTTSGGRAAN